MSAELPITAAVPRRWFGAPRWLVALLGVSLAANLLIVGMVGGAIWRHRGNPQQGFNMLGYVASLPSERRQMIFGKAGHHRAELQPIRQELRAARQAMMDVLVAEPFDRARFVATQEKHAELLVKFRKVEFAFMADLAVTLLPEERRAFARWREQRRGQGRWGEDGEDAGGKGKRP